VTGGLIDTVRAIVREELARLRSAELARVVEQHPHAGESDKDNYACSVELRDSGIVLKRVPVATAKLGAASIPAVGDLVLVQFIGGDIDAPVIVGSLYNDEDRPPVNADGEAVLRLPLAAGAADAALIVVSTADGPALKVQMGGTMVTVQDADPAVQIDVADGSATVEIAGNGALKVESGGNMTLKASGNIDIEAGGTLTLKGATVNIN
jgi:uncharacterized protein involved in type VI secretion and phage assembly